jgi:hypothetical protein
MYQAQKENHSDQWFFCIEKKKEREKMKKLATPFPNQEQKLVVTVFNLQSQNLIWWYLYFDSSNAPRCNTFPRLRNVLIQYTCPRTCRL